MKKFTTLLLVLALTLSTLLSVVPFSAFAEETAVTFTDNTGYTTGGNGGSIFRKKGDGSVMLSPFNTPLRDMITAGAAYSEFTIKMTFTLLSGNNGTEVHTFDTVSAAINKSNGQYFDIFLNGTGGNCGFCPTINEYYNVYVEIYRQDVMVIYGTYTNQWVYPTIADAGVYYTPTALPGEGEEEEPDVPEITYPITIEDTGAQYLGFRYKSSSNGDIVFCPNLKTTDPIDGSSIGTVVNRNRSNYVAEIAVYYQAGGKDCSEEETVYLTTFETNLEANSNGGSAYTDICIASADDDNGFCPIEGQYYTLVLNIYDTNGTLLYKDGTYKNMTGSDNSKYVITQSDYYYSSEVFYAGAQTGDSAIRFVGGVSEAAVAIYDKVDLQVSFTGDGVARTFTAPTTSVYQTLKGSKNGQVFNAVTVYGSGVEAEETVDAAYLFGYAVTDVPEGTYTVTITPIAYIGETAVEGKVATYTSVTVAANGTVTLTK